MGNSKYLLDEFDSVDEYVDFLKKVNEEVGDDAIPAYEEKVKKYEKELASMDKDQKRELLLILQDEAWYEARLQHYTLKHEQREVK